MRHDPKPIRVKASFRYRVFVDNIWPTVGLHARQRDPRDRRIVVGSTIHSLPSNNRKKPGSNHTVFLPPSSGRNTYLWCNQRMHGMKRMEYKNTLDKRTLEHEHKTSLASSGTPRTRFSTDSTTGRKANDNAKSADDIQASPTPPQPPPPYLRATYHTQTS